MTHLDAYGWNAHFAALLEPHELPQNIARVVQEHKEAYLVRTIHGNIWAEITGKMRHTSTVRLDFPAVGDWVILRGLEHADGGGPVHITRILPRRTILSRRLETGKGGGGDQHVLATNIDVVFLGTSLNENFNLRRMERYLTLARDSGAQPVLLLTKADLCDDPHPLMQQAHKIAHGAAVHAVSVVTGQGIDLLKIYLPQGITGVILGSSGIGKSTLVNHLADADIQDMMQIREFDDKGRHCTTFRHLVKTTTGGLIIDTPGLRGLSLGEASDALLSTFQDIESLALRCRFTDCRHNAEPGCAIKAAIDAGTLTAARLEGYLRLHREITAMSQRENRIAQRKERKMEKRSTAAAHDKALRDWHLQKRRHGR
ncbi:MAG: ribosome small subunit-dependent GTPase A [Phycisphaerales bacterium]|nr:ribosome small subunit-dependent GTPase A [Phycisphaerales bacterium]